LLTPCNQELVLNYHLHHVLIHHCVFVVFHSTKG
jgi:hypothetical protein